MNWDHILTKVGCTPATVAKWAPCFASEVKPNTFSKGLADIVDWLPEILHESGMLKRVIESLDYSVDGLLATFGNRITPQQAAKYGRISGKQSADQVQIALIVYGGEWGRKNLGNTQLGDGWKFRGRSPIQITGRANYRRVGDLMGQDLETLPELLEQPRYALDACIAWWEDKIPDSLLGETTMIRKRVNGGTIGLAEVQRLTVLVKEAVYGGEG